VFVLAALSVCMQIAINNGVVAPPSTPHTLRIRMRNYGTVFTTLNRGRMLRQITFVHGVVHYTAYHGVGEGHRV
jgi:hypothetical protein